MNETRRRPTGLPHEAKATDIMVHSLDRLVVYFFCIDSVSLGCECGVNKGVVCHGCVRSSLTFLPL